MNAEDDIEDQDVPGPEEAEADTAETEMPPEQQAGSFAWAA